MAVVIFSADALLVLVAGFGLIMVSIGVLCLFKPSCARFFFGTAGTQRADVGGFTALTGIRDVYLGGTLIILALLRQSVALGWVALLGTLTVAMMDGSDRCITSRGSGAD